MAENKYTKGIDSARSGINQTVSVRDSLKLLIIEMSFILGFSMSNESFELFGSIYFSGFYKFIRGIFRLHMEIRAAHFSGRDLIGT